MSTTSTLGPFALTAAELLARVRPGSRVRIVNLNGNRVVTIDDVDGDGKNGVPVITYDTSLSGSGRWAYITDIREILS